MIEELLNYQTADKDLKAIEDELYKSEERKKAVSAKKYLDSVEENVNKLNARAETLSASYENALNEIKSLKEQEEELGLALEKIGDENEIAFLTKKAEELIGKIKNLSATAQKLSSDIQSVLQEYKTIKDNTKIAQAQYNENGKKYNELKASKQAEREVIEKKLEGLKKKVEPSLMERYLKKRENKIYPVIYEVGDKVCGACNMELSMSELNKLKSGEIIECDHCGRLLYSKS